MSTSSERRTKTSGTPSGSRKKVKKRSLARSIGKAFLTAFLIFVITCTLIGGAIAIYIINFVQPQNIKLDSADLDSTTIIYANDAATNKPKPIAQVNGEQNRIWVSIKSMPDNLKNAFISTEDQRFYEHSGVDWKRTFGAVGNLVFHFYGSRQGGSTITQQLVNNITEAGKNKNDYARKIQEIVSALALEKRYSKPQILEAYLNTINLNEGCYGVETAAQNYFGKDVKNLDLAECAALACLPKAPSTYDPRNHPDKNTERRVNTVLKNMYDQKRITKAQYEAAIKEKLNIVKKKSVSKPRSWFVDMVISDVQKDLQTQYGWSAQFALNEIYTKGLRIYTTENERIQNDMDTVYNTGAANEDYWYMYDGKVQPQSAMMIVDYSGNILGVEGGRGTKNGNMILDRATDTERQPGSSLKPLGVYAPAIELNKINWSTLVSCSKSNIGGKLWPQNDGNEGYDGSMTVVSALAESINTVAVHIDKDYLSPSYTFDFLKNKLGFSSLVDRKVINGKVYSDKNISIAIGALTSGVTVREMCGGYEMFGNNGLYYKPHSYSQVLDCSGNVLLTNKTTPGKKAIGADTAFIMNHLLVQNVERSDGTGQKAAISGVTVGGKTGTTNDHKDRWFCGVTPDYVGVVWFGYDTPKNIPGYRTDTNPALRAWRSVMAQADANPVKNDFPSNGDVVSLRYDANSGYVTDGGGEIGWYKEKGIINPAPVPPSAS